MMKWSRICGYLGQSLTVLSLGISSVLFFALFNVPSVSADAPPVIKTCEVPLALYEDFGSRI